MSLRYQAHALTDEAEKRRTLAEDVRRGLTGSPRSLPPKYFYDATGSRLFEDITELPEYYLTRTEVALLAETVPALMGELGPVGVVGDQDPATSRHSQWESARPPLHPHRSGRGLDGDGGETAARGLPVSSRRSAGGGLRAPPPGCTRARRPPPDAAARQHHRQPRSSGPPEIAGRSPWIAGPW